MMLQLQIWDLIMLSWSSWRYCSALGPSQGRRQAASEPGSLGGCMVLWHRRGIGRRAATAPARCRRLSLTGVSVPAAGTTPRPSGWRPTTPSCASAAPRSWATPEEAPHRCTRGESGPAPPPSLLSMAVFPLPPFAEATLQRHSLLSVSQTKASLVQVAPATPNISNIKIRH